MIRAIRRISYPARVLIGIAIVIAIFWLRGPLRADRGANVTQEGAIDIAMPHIDFEPEHIATRFLRQGFENTPVWAVSFGILVEGSRTDFVQLVVVEVNASSGEVLRVRTQQ